jgi:ABC-type spermidine/putrescine transport system permease subunit II
MNLKKRVLNQTMTNNFLKSLVAGILVGLSVSTFFNVTGFNMTGFIIAVVSFVVFVLFLIYFNVVEKHERIKQDELNRLRELNSDVRL